MRNKVGTSAINRRKLIKNITKKEPTPQSNKIVPASTNINAAGIVVAAPGAAERASGNEPVSTDITGKKIEVDEEGRMSLDEIKKMNIVEQLGRGAVVPTEQMVGIAKDLAYGVSSENQATMESGLDLIINPLVKPYADERMKTSGVISDEWYWPEELKSDWNVLPEFMRKSDRVEKRSFIEGVSANVGNIGAISQAPLAGQIRDKEFGVSADRFSQAPGYYVGSALGEIPYFLIGVGEVKAAATVSAKAAAGVIRGSVKGTTGLKLVQKAYKVEKAASTLSSAVARSNAGKMVNKKAVLGAVKTLRKGYGEHVNVINKKATTVDEALDDHLISSRNNAITASTKLDKFETLINKIETTKSPELKQQRIEELNSIVATDLLPQTRKFKDVYLAETAKLSTNTRAERLASAIQGSPTNFESKIDNFFNKPGRATGDEISDTDVIKQSIFRNTLYANRDAGEYTGVLGNLKLNRHLYGNVLSSSLGITRKTEGLNQIAEIFSRTVLESKTLDHAGIKKMRQNIDDEIDRVKGERELNKIYNETDKVKDNDLMIKRLEESKTLSFTPKSFKIGDPKKQNWDTGSESKTTQWVWDYEAIKKVYPELAGAFERESVNLAVRPSVNLRQSKGLISGTIGDGADRFDIYRIAAPRSEALTTFGKEQVGPLNKIKGRVGLRTVGRGKRKFKTLIPKKKEQTEYVYGIYQPKDNLQVAGSGKSGVRPVVRLSKDTPTDHIAIIKDTGMLSDFKGLPGIGKILGDGADGNYNLYEYTHIKSDKINAFIDAKGKEWKVGDADPLRTHEINVKTDGPAGIYQDNKWRYMGDVLLGRAMIENRPVQVLELIDDKIEKIDNRVKFLDNKYGKDVKRVAKRDKDKPWAEENVRSIEDSYLEERKRMLSMKERLQKNKNIEKSKEISKSLQAGDWMTPQGTLTTFTEKTLKDIDQKTRPVSVVREDMNNPGNFYYKSDQGVFLIKDIKTFNPDIITTADDVRLARQIFTPNKIDGGDAGTKIIDKDKKFVAGSEPIEPIMEVADGITKVDDYTAGNWMNLSKPETYAGRLTKLTDDEVGKLEYGTNWERVKKLRDERAGIDIDSADIIKEDSLGRVELSKKSLKKHASSAAKVELNTLKTDKLLAFLDLKDNIRTKLTGKRWRNVEIRSFKPDDETLKDRSYSFFENIQSGKSTTNRGFTPFSKIFNVDPQKGITQSGDMNIAGVISHPVYTMMDPHFLYKETRIKEVFYDGVDPLVDAELNRRNRLKVEKRTNYKVLEDAVRTLDRNPNNAVSDTPSSVSFAMDTFKKQMVNLVRKKGINESGEVQAPLGMNSDAMIKIVNNPDKYKSVVLDFLDKPDNKYVRGSTRRDRIKKKYNFINPEVDLPGLGVRFERKNPLKILWNQGKSQLVGTETYLSAPHMQFGLSVEEITKYMPGRINRTARKVADKLGVKHVTTEQDNPFLNEAIKKVLGQYPEKSMTRDMRKMYKRSQSMGPVADDVAIGQSINKRITAADKERLERVKYLERKKESIRKEIDREKDDVMKDKTMSLDEKTKAIENWNKQYGYKIKPLDKELNKLDTMGYAEDKPVSGVTTFTTTGTKKSNIEPWDTKTDLRGGIMEKKARGFGSGKELTEEQTYLFVKTLFEQKIGKVDRSKASDPDRRRVNLELFRMMDEGLTDAQKKKSFKSPKDLDELMSGPDGQKIIESDAFQKGLKMQQEMFDEYKGVSRRQLSRERKVDERYTKKGMQESRNEFSRNFVAQFGNRPIGFKQQSTPGVKLSAMLSDGLFGGSETQQIQSEQTIPFAAYAEPQLITTPDTPVNMIDQTISDIQKTLSGVTQGNVQIGKSSSGLDVKSYQVSESLNIFGSASVERQQQSIDISSGLAQPQEFGKIVIPDIQGIYDTVPRQEIIPRETQSFALKQSYPQEAKLMKALPVPIKPIVGLPERIVPFAPVLGGYVPPGDPSHRRFTKPRKKKTKKTWWQTPENWYEPYYWGGKDQTGSGYVTFTGKEPAKVRKYEKKFFGIGVNDTPFGLKELRFK